MGLLDSLGGGKKGKTKGKTKTVGIGRKGGTSTTAGTTRTATQTQGTQRTAGTQTQQQFQFTPEQLATMNSIINRAASKQSVYGPQAQSLADLAAQTTQQVTDAVSGAGAETDAIVRSALDNARLGYEQGELADYNRFADSLGGQNNSAVMLMKQQGRENLGMKLAAIEGDIRQRAVDQRTALFGTAAGVQRSALEGQQSVDLGGSLALQDALSALNVAKGGVSQGVTQDLQDTVFGQRTTGSTFENQITKDLQTVYQQEETESKGKTSQGGSVLDFLDVLSQFGGGGYAPPA